MFTATWGHAAAAAKLLRQLLSGRCLPLPLLLALLQPF